MLFAKEDWPTRSRASHLYRTVGIPGARRNRPILDRGLADAQTSNTSDWIDGVIEPCRRPGRKHMPTMTSWIDKNGRRKVRGILNVLASQLHIHVAWAKESMHATLASTWPDGLQLSLSDSRRLPRGSSRELRRHELRRRG
jgi:hypothetical protein